MGIWLFRFSLFGGKNAFSVAFFYFFVCHKIIIETAGFAPPNSIDTQYRHCVFLWESSIGQHKQSTGCIVIAAGAQFVLLR